MAISATKTQAAVATGTSTTPGATLAASPTDGNLLVAFVQTATSAVSMTAKNGYTKLTMVSQGTSNLFALLWKVASGDVGAQAPADLGGSVAWVCSVIEWNAGNGWNVTTLWEGANADNTATKTLSPGLNPPDGIAALLVGAASTAANKTWASQIFTATGLATGGVVEQIDSGDGDEDTDPVYGGRFGHGHRGHDRRGGSQWS